VAASTLGWIDTRGGRVGRGAADDTTAEDDAMASFNNGRLREVRARVVAMEGVAALELEVVAGREGEGGAVLLSLSVLRVRLKRVERFGAGVASCSAGA